MSTYSFPERVLLRLRRRLHIPRKETTRQRLAPGIERPLRDGVVRRQETGRREVELDRVANLGDERVGLEDEGIIKGEVLDGEDLEGGLRGGAGRERDGGDEDGAERYHFGGSKKELGNKRES